MPGASGRVGKRSASSALNKADRQGDEGGDLLFCCVVVVDRREKRWRDLAPVFWGDG